MHELRVKRYRAGAVGRLRLAAVPQVQPAALPPGSRIAEYEIVRVLGAGGFGITYLAYDHQLDGPVALKEYFPADVASRADGSGVAVTTTTNQDVFAWGLDRFIQEARAIHRLRHPNVVRAHRYLEANGTAYIVLEYVEGEPLKAILDRRGRLSANEWRPWMDALLDGLAHVHAHGYLHRDIKPANIVVRSDNGEPVMIDFGSARLQHGDRTLTQVLTAGYAPIEQYSNDAAQGPQGDIYAMAAVSYRVLTGRTVPSAPDRVLNDDHKPLVEGSTDADLQWLTAIDRGLALRPDDRPQTVEEWRAELDTDDATSSVATQPQPAEAGAKTATPRPPDQALGETGKFATKMIYPSPDEALRVHDVSQERRRRALQTPEKPPQWPHAWVVPVLVVAYIAILGFLDVISRPNLQPPSPSAPADPDAGGINQGRTGIASSPMRPSATEAQLELKRDSKAPLTTAKWWEDRVKTNGTTVGNCRAWLRARIREPDTSVYEPSVPLLKRCDEAMDFTGRRPTRRTVRQPQRKLIGHSAEEDRAFRRCEREYRNAERGIRGLAIRDQLGSVSHYLHLDQKNDAWTCMRAIDRDEASRVYREVSNR